MQDPRYDHLAEVLTGYSTRLQSGEKVLIDTFDAPPEIIISLIRKAREKGAVPLVNLQSSVVNPTIGNRAQALPTARVSAILRGVIPWVS